MGTSMSDPLIAQRNRLQLRAKTLASLTKKDISLKNKTEIKQPIVSPRALSHSDRLQKKEKVKRTINVKDKPALQNMQLNNTPAFSSQVAEDYLSIAEPQTQSVKSSQIKRRKIDARLNNCQNNYYILVEKNHQEPKKQKNRESKINYIQQAQIKLPINSLIKQESQQLHVTFSQAVAHNFIQKNENSGDDVKSNSQKSLKVNSLLVKIKQQKKDKQNLLNKYLPKPKGQKRQFIPHQFTFPKQDKLVKMSLRSSKIQNPQPKQDPINYSQKIYKNWKSREKYRKDSILKLSNKSSEKIINVNDCYGISGNKKLQQKKQANPNSGSKLIEQKNKQQTLKLISSNINQKTISRSHRQSLRSEKRLKLIYF